MSSKCYDTDEINKKMDALSISILASITQILRERQYLEDNLKEGYINMAKSRYIMRGQNISMLQINTSNLKSTLKTSNSLCVLEGAEYTSFLPVELKNSMNENTQNCTNVTDELCDGIENVTVTSRNESEEPGSNLEKDIHVASNDPLKWFGVLVPDVLKKSQMRFKQATVTALQIASLQNQLKSLCAEYKTLRLLKKQSIEKD